MNTRRAPAPIRLRRRHPAALRPSDAPAALRPSDAPAAAGAERRAAGRPAGSPNTGPGPGAAARRRRLDAPQDRAVYTCGCGYVFEAAVSTSVGCPHCGDAQAW